MYNMLLQAIKAALGAPPFFKEEDGQAQQNGSTVEGSKAEGSNTTAKAQQASHRPAVLADGSYASQTALTDTFTMPSMASNSPLNLRWVTVQSSQSKEQIVWGCWGLAQLLAGTFGYAHHGCQASKKLFPHKVP